MKWEYLIEIIEYESTHDLEDKLNSFGDDKWEVSAILDYRSTDEIKILFKRLKDEN